jgi:putative ABC transport system permease protein
MTRTAARTPLAWANLTHDPKRLATSLAGVAFAVVLIFTELGFLHALLDSTVAPLLALDARPTDLVMTHREKETLTDSRRFARRWLTATQDIAGVERARPLFIEKVASEWYEPRSGEARKVRVLSWDAETPLFRLPGGAPTAARLGAVGTALYDERSKAAYGFDRLARGPRGVAEAILARTPIRIVGTFSMGTDFAVDGNLIVGARTFAALFPMRLIGDPDVATVDLGLIRLAPTADSAAVLARLRRALPEKRLPVRILTLRERIDAEKAFWSRHAPIGQIFLLGVVIGFIVGVVICYQVLSSDIRDHTAEYATLKAIGYSDGFLVRVVFRQALWLATLGFIPGLAVSVILYAALRALTGLPMSPTWDRIGVVLALTFAMCLVSAYLAIRRLFTADPAELFR